MTAQTKAPATAPAAPVPAAGAPATPASAPKKGHARWLAGSKVEKGLVPAQAKTIPDGAVITVLVTGNPKRKAPAARFAKYKTGMTADQYAKAVGNATLAKLDLAWDYNHGFIGLSALEAAPVAKAA